MSVFYATEMIKETMPHLGGPLGRPLRGSRTFGPGHEKAFGATAMQSTILWWASRRSSRTPAGRSARGRLWRARVGASLATIRHPSA